MVFWKKLLLRSMLCNHFFSSFSSEMFWLLFGYSRLWLILLITPWYTSSSSSSSSPSFFKLYNNICYVSKQLLRFLLYPSSGSFTNFSKSNWLISLLIPVDCPQLLLSLSFIWPRVFILLFSLSLVDLLYSIFFLCCAFCQNILKWFFLHVWSERTIIG